MCIKRLHTVVCCNLQWWLRQIYTSLCVNATRLMLIIVNGQLTVVHIWIIIGQSFLFWIFVMFALCARLLSFWHTWDFSHRFTAANDQSKIVRFYRPNNTTFSSFAVNYHWHELSWQRTKIPISNWLSNSVSFDVQLNLLQILCHYCSFRHVKMFQTSRFHFAFMIIFKYSISCTTNQTSFLNGNHIEIVHVCPAYE